MSTSDDTQDDTSVFPFAADAESDFYFAPPAIAQRLDLIQYLIEYSGQLLLIIGEHGVGKTSMIRQLILRAGSVWQICHIEANAMLEVRAMQRRIGEAFDWAPREAELQDHALYVAGLEKKLEACEHANLVPVIIVDDAHELPAESLLFLFSLAKAEDQREQLHIALFCEPQINQMLNSPRLAEFKENIMHVLDIPPLTEDQVLQYMEEKCAEAGLLGELPFSDEALDQIQLHGKGLPGRINLLADQHMRGEPLSLPREHAAPLDRNLPPLMRNRTQLLMLAGLLGLVTLVIALNSFFSSSDDSSLEAEDETQEPIEVVTRSPAADPEPATSPPKRNPVAAVDSNPEPGQPTLVAPTAQPTLVEPTAKPRPTATELPTIPPKSTPTPKAKPKPSATPTPVARPTPTLEPRPTPTVVPSPKPMNAAPPELPDGVSGPDWLKNQRSADFVVQLFGTHDRAALRRFVTDHKLHGHLAWFATNRDGKQWYVLVQGAYPDHNKAVSAIQGLPPKVQAIKPWARSVAAIHSAMGIAPEPRPTVPQPTVKPTAPPPAGKAKVKAPPRPASARPN